MIPYHRIPFDICIIVTREKHPVYVYVYVRIRMKRDRATRVGRVFVTRDPRRVET